jgi:hypothetical protein
LDFVKFPEDFQRILWDVHFRTGRNRSRKRNFGGGRGQSIPDVIELILKEAFQIVCIFLLNKGIAGVGWGTLNFWSIWKILALRDFFGRLDKRWNKLKAQCTGAEWWGWLEFSVPENLKILVLRKF